MNLVEFNSSKSIGYLYQEDIKSAKSISDNMRTTSIASLAGGYGSETIYAVEIATVGDAYDLSKSKSLIKVSNTSVVKADKIFFGDSSFPSLLLGRLNTDIKRTTKSDNATKIILDHDINRESIFHRIFLYDDTNNVGVYADVNWSESKTSYVQRITRVINNLSIFSNYQVKLYYSVSYDNYKLYDIYQKSPNKFTSTNELAKYVCNQLPAITDQEYCNVSDMLRSQDKATVNLALGTLQYYNFFNYGIDIISDLTTGNCLDLPSSREAEYIYFLLGTSRSLLYDSRHYNITRKINFLMDCFNKFVISPSMSVKEKIYTTLRGELYHDISEKYQTEFERLNVTLSLVPNDENGETNVSSSEVEGEES